MAITSDEIPDFRILLGAPFNATARRQWNLPMRLGQREQSTKFRQRLRRCEVSFIFLALHR
jgi:hypothetical protein